MATITAVVITKDEEDKIAECLERVEWADEIIVMDDESTDRTVEIARTFTDKVFIRRLNGNFAEQRNAGAEKATGDWILQLDADEQISEVNAQEIRGLINNPGNFAAFRFMRRNHFLGHFMRYGGSYDYYIRLYKKTKARFGGTIHETLEVDGEIGTAQSDICHYPFKSISQYLERQNYYTSRGAHLLLEKEGIVSRKKIRYHLTIRPLRLIWKSYIKKKGYRDGFYGLVQSILEAFGQFSIWAKYWERVKDKSEIRISKFLSRTDTGRQ